MATFTVKRARGRLTSSDIARMIMDNDSDSDLSSLTDSEAESDSRPINHLFDLRNRTVNLMLSHIQYRRRQT